MPVKTMAHFHRKSGLVPVIFLVIGLLACGREAVPPAGQPQAAIWNGNDWRAEIHLPEVTLPVALHFDAEAGEAWFANGIERVPVGEVDIDGNRYRLRFPAFNNTLELVREGDALSGMLTLVKRGYEQHLPVIALPDPRFRFSPDPRAEIDVTGRWEVVFTDDEGVATPAVGEFDQQGSLLTGTFLVATGDYRYLAGEVDGRTLRLSTFDGAHAFVFTATMGKGGELAGDFWSGNRWHERWRGRRNFDARLPDAYSLTWLKEGYETLRFEFPDLKGRTVSLDDPKYQGKVVLVTLSGSWCPNCADEAEFLSGFYRDNRQRGLEIITLLFEHVTDYQVAATLGRELVEKHGIGFDVLVAGYSDKADAARALPMLNHVMAYPTMIFIDRAAKVRHIHTGFSGPGTGAHYLDFVREFNALMDELLAEPAPREL